MCLHFWHFPAIIGFTSKINIVREAPGGELILPGAFLGAEVFIDCHTVETFAVYNKSYIFIAGREEMANILIVEDDRTINDLICDYLSDVGLLSVRLTTGNRHLNYFTENRRSL